MAFHRFILNTCRCLHVTRFVLFLHITFTYSAPIRNENVKHERDAQNASNNVTLQTKSTALRHLNSYGYLFSPTGMISGLMDEGEAFTKAITLYQQVWGLPTTGVLDVDTTNLLATDRCGNSDDALILKAQGLQNVKRKRYLAADHWDKVHLTYMISMYSVKTQLTKKQIDDAIANALNMWAEVSYLTFDIDLDKPDIVVLFTTGKHGDKFPFDGQSGVLAHAFFPYFGGDLHIDDDEPWHYLESEGREITQVALHELGHALGLDHSAEYDAIMYPYYRYRPVLKLANDDILGIQSIYGKPTVAETTPPPLATSDWCKATSIDAATYDTNKIIYLFKGDEYIALDKDGILADYPRSIESTYPILGAKVDASVLLPTTYICVDKNTTRYFACLLYDTYYFKGGNYILFRRSILVEYGQIRDRFPGIPENIDSAFLREDDNIYFTKGDNIWQFVRGRGVAYGFPKKISDILKGLPNYLDAAFLYPFQINGETHYYNFFFAGPNYYAFYGQQNELNKNSTPPFPRSITSWWFGCAENNQTKRNGSLGELTAPGLPRIKRTFYAEMQGFDQSLPIPKQAIDKSNSFVRLNLSDITPVVDPSTVTVTDILPNNLASLTSSTPKSTTSVTSTFVRLMSDATSMSMSFNLTTISCIVAIIAGAL